MLGNEEVQAIRTKSFRLHCLEMRLRSRSPKFPSYEGPGTIRQDPKGILSFEIFDQEQEPQDPTRVPGTGAPGKLIPEEDYYELTAVDDMNRRWSTERVLPNTAGRMGRSGVLCYGKLREIQCPEEGEFPGHLWLFIPGSFDMPANRFTKTVKSREGTRVWESSARDTWQMEFPWLSLSITHESDGLVISASPKGDALPSGLDTRLEESLWFTLGHLCHWQIMMERKNGRGRTGIKSQTWEDFKPRLLPPVDWYWHPIEFQTEAFQRYLEYITDYDRPRYHPTSVNVLDILTASIQSIEAQALALGVAVESLIRREYGYLGDPSPDEESQVNDLLALIEASGTKAEMKKRARGAINKLKSVNLEGCLRELQRDGHVSEDLIDAWRKVRHPGAHGDDAERPLEELVALCDKTHVLFNLLIFSRIGYTGEYTDRSSRGWPTKLSKPFWKPRSLS